MLALPIARDRTGSSQEGQQLVGRDLLYSLYLSQCATERLEDGASVRKRMPIACRWVT
jgi:hypothetical protein